MLNITLRDKKRNDWVRDQTKVYDIIKSVGKSMWAGHLARRNDNSWTLRLTTQRHMMKTHDDTDELSVMPIFGSLYSIR